MKRKFRHFHHHHHHYHSCWWKIRAVLAQILIPLICFQFIRTLFLPTTFDIILLMLMVGLYFCLRLRLF